MAGKKPAPFLKVRVHALDANPSITGLCVGYEDSKWRTSAFARHILEWLPEFALNHSEAADLDSGDSLMKLIEAAVRVYQSRDHLGRGEFGEVILHACIRQVFNSQPAISKIYYKTSSNDTVKGFDAVHIVDNEGELELWLGEAKFFASITDAIGDVVAELNAHTQINYLKDELLHIRGKVDKQWPHAQRVLELLGSNVSLDEIFARAAIPVLLTYESKCVANFSECSTEYATAFETEIMHYYDLFQKKNLPKNITIHLILVPLHIKKELVDQLDTRLKAIQSVR